MDQQIIEKFIWLKKIFLNLFLDIFVITIYPEAMENRQRFEIFGITTSDKTANSVKVELTDGSVCTIQEYYKNKYDITLRLYHSSINFY